MIERGIAYVILLDVGLLIYREGVEVDDVVGAWGIARWQISQDSLKLLALGFGFEWHPQQVVTRTRNGSMTHEPSFRVWLSDWEKWGCQRIKGRIEEGRLDLALFWEESRQDLSFSGAFFVVWEEE